MFRPGLSLSLVLALIAVTRAEDELPRPRWNIAAECQMVTLPQKAALPLIAEFNEESKTEAAWAKLQQMIEQGAATLVANIVLKGEADTKLVSESVEEVRYPTEFDPPQLPTSIPVEKGAEVLKHWPIVGITPTSFETRSVGAFLELAAEVSADGAWIAAEVVPQHVRLQRLVKYDAGVMPSGERLSVEQPQFMTLKNTLSTYLPSGQRVLVGVHKLPDAVNMMELFILRVSASKVGARP